MTMFDQLGFINRWRMSKRTVSKFILMVKRGYRDPPYHNWYHAFSVCHFVYVMAKNCGLATLLRDIEVLGLFVASICHDVDHRGTNNSFQVESKSTLAALYSSEGSVLERHHFAQTLCILNANGCNLFENMDSEQYSRILDLIRDIILATDLGRHFKIAKQQAEMISKGYDSEDEQHRSLLLFMLMTAADLNDSAKRWRNARASAHLICQEFFHQGDMERQIGRQPMEMMDRERANIPELQIGFLQHVAYGVFKNLSVMFLPTKVLIDNIDQNIEVWKQKRDQVQSGQIHGNSIEEMFWRVTVPADEET